jgi:hypothetical protein
MNSLEKTFQAKYRTLQCHKIIIVAKETHIFANVSESSLGATGKQVARGPFKICSV